ncbi:hypothetical protein HBH98_036080 [Parastagonospora nodorum]|nr:hypothetical protein HBH53_010580 [Parastagonospora nodorum]KAH3986010.1 hypothetical protein HBH52_041780 [Parastagonospora nodorum]KAH3987972.1 hypothetical protein HBH51_007250 [Parastagonospora nodorum]KAH4040131.1 hypothetical protein HBI09_024130 [Parastagonospora nodorum]KAH4071551.1 hypothetical protein HBH50_082110 [Parastagonospora nodorum]
MALNNTRSVCVVGAGPAGLVAAKTFLQTGGYAVTVFEAADRVGGMWRGRPGEYGDKCDPGMRTNLSRFTVAFSDLSWPSVDLSDPVTGLPAASSTPMFPKAWQVGRYLENYAERLRIFNHITFNTKVVSAHLQDESMSWNVVCVDTLTDQRTHHTFDYLVVASGFFDHPMPKDFFDDSNLSLETHPAKGEHPRHYQHSSRFRTLSGLTDRAGKIAVIGGGISGAEAAAQAAMQISSAKFSPGAKGIHANSEIYHIINRPFYCMPRYLPQDPDDRTQTGSNPAPHFLPLDMVLYNLSRRGGGEISAAIATVPPEKAAKGHEFLRSVIGSDQSDLGHFTLVYDDDQMQYPAYTGITDTYTEFVRSGVIVPVQGFVNKVSERDADLEGFKIGIAPKAPWKIVDCSRGDPCEHVYASAIIEATGYSSSIEYLRDCKPLIASAYDSECPRIPLKLSRGCVFAQEVPTLGFVGFYEGPYWSVMEQQARLLVETWTSETPEMARNRDGKIFQTDDAENMRAAIKVKSLQVPQFWQADYVGLVEDFARHTGVVRNDSTFGDGTGPVFAARYCGDSRNEQALAVVAEVAELIKTSQSHARFVAAAVFRGMQGVWTISRKIGSHKHGISGGSFEGTAHFHPRFPSDATYAAEYLYIEDGSFVMETGLSFPATRRYIYRYNEVTDKISAWFAEDDGETVGRLFNTWDFEEPSSSFVGWVARGHHWCDPDTYKATCEFRFKGATLEGFSIEYDVEGPNKDYTHQSKYVRP